ncbi:hypothetical protein [Aliivibrio wodanis]|uniref:hypothetical protein n=1 Tax=Aliivibrio wodanis TaxID=80852 RepID=UPI00406CF9AD
MSSEQKREQIINNRWSQGSTFPYKAIDETLHIDGRSCSYKVTPKHVAHLMVISQDCDIANGGDDDSHVECLLLKKQKNPFFRNFNGHNPRKLHIEIGDTCWEIAAKNSVFINKDFLLENDLSQLSPLEVLPESVNIIKQWKANRYTRSGLPESFVKITESVLADFENSQFLATYISAIKSIRIFCEERDEQFDCSFILMYDSNYCDKFAIDLNEMEELFNESLLSPLSELEGISLLNTDDGDNVFTQLSLNDLMSDLEFTFAAMCIYPRYYFDAKSFEQGIGADELQED